MAFNSGTPSFTKGHLIKKTIIILIAITIVMCGCANTTKNKGEAALKYIEKKYGEDFTPITYDMSDYLSDTDIVECYPSWMNPDFEYVSIYIHDNGKSFGDNYFEFLKRDELENSVKDIIEADFGKDAKVYQSCSNMEMPSTLTADSSLDDLYSSMKDYCIWADVFIKSSEIIPKEEFEHRVDSVKERFCQTGKSFVIHIYVINDSAYENIRREDRSEVMDAYRKNWEADGDIVKNKEDMMIIMGELK